MFILVTERGLDSQALYSCLLQLMELGFVVGVSVFPPLVPSFK